MCSSCSGGMGATHPNRYFTFVGVFHRIADQVQQDLAQAVVIAHDHGGNVVVDVPVQAQALLLRLWLENVDHAANDPFQIEGRVVELVLAGLDLRQVQHVVDQRVQGDG